MSTTSRSPRQRRRRPSAKRLGLGLHLGRFDDHGLLHGQFGEGLGRCEPWGAGRVPLVFTHHTLYERYTHYVPGDSPAPLPIAPFRGTLDWPANGRIVSRSIDDRIGAFVVLEALRLLAERSPRPRACGAAVATTQEEIAYHGGGARTSAHSFRPDVALVVDVTFATDSPQVEKKQVGEHRLGGGPVLGRGSAIHPLVFDRLVQVAEGAEIAYSIQANARATHTDADAIHLSRDGVATGVISVPNRYMHSPNEMVSLADLEATARLMAEFVASLDDDGSAAALHRNRHGSRQDDDRHPEHAKPAPVRSPRRRDILLHQRRSGTGTSRRSSKWWGSPIWRIACPMSFPAACNNGSPSAAR